MKKRILGFFLVLVMSLCVLGGCGDTEQGKDDNKEEKYSLRLMSNNVWSCDTNSGAWQAIGYDCSAPVRAEGFLKVYQETSPDVIGMQECTVLMKDEITSNLAEAGLTYSVIEGGHTPIFYRSDKLEVVETTFEQYPEAVPGYEGSFNNGQTKSWNVAVFKIKETGDNFIFLNTHLWWKSGSPGSNNYQEGSDEARKYQLEIAISKIKEYQETYKCAAILVGDLNAEYKSIGLEYAFEEGFKHGHDIAVDYVDETCGMHECTTAGFGPIRPGTFEEAIDHILVNGAEEGAVRRFERYSPQYYVSLSDHSPVYIDMEF